MKAKFYIGIISALLLAGSPMAAQFADEGFRSDNSGLVINNYYYNDYDYYFASRINRFHRSYAAFNYYSPVFTDTYFYTYRPYSWGLSIYGGGFGFNLGYTYSYPVYDYGWYDPYFGTSWYWGYDPFFYNYTPYLYTWYSPVIININVRNRWRPWHSGWYGYDRGYYGHNRWYNDYRPVYHTQNYYYNSSPRYSSRDLPDRKGSTEINRSNSGDQSRRYGTTIPGSRGVDNNGNPLPDNTRNGEIRRNTNPGDSRGQGNNNNNNDGGNNNGNNGNNRNNANNGNNNNSRPDGNNGNFDQNDRNRGNNGNNRNSDPGGNSGNFGNKGNPVDAGKGRVAPSVNAPVRRTESATTSRSQSNTRVMTTQSSRNQSSAVRSTPSRTQVSRSSPAPASRPSASSSSRSSGRSASTPSQSSSSRSSGSSSKSSSSKSSSENGKRR